MPYDTGNDELADYVEPFLDLPDAEDALGALVREALDPVFRASRWLFQHVREYPGFRWRKDAGGWRIHRDDRGDAWALAQILAMYMMEPWTLIEAGVDDSLTFQWRPGEAVSCLLPPDCSAEVRLGANGIWRLSDGGAVLRGPGGLVRCDLVPGDRIEIHHGLRHASCAVKRDNQTIFSEQSPGGWELELALTTPSSIEQLRCTCRTAACSERHVWRGQEDVKWFVHNAILGTTGENRKIRTKGLLEGMFFWLLASSDSGGPGVPKLAHVLVEKNECGRCGELYEGPACSKDHQFDPAAMRTKSQRVIIAVDPAEPTVYESSLETSNADGHGEDDENDSGGNAETAQLRVVRATAPSPYDFEPRLRCGVCLSLFPLSRIAQCGSLSLEDGGAGLWRKLKVEGRHALYPRFRELLVSTHSPEPVWCPYCEGTRCAACTTFSNLSDRDLLGQRCKSPECSELILRNRDRSDFAQSVWRGLDRATQQRAEDQLRTKRCPKCHGEPTFADLPKARCTDGHELFRSSLPQALWFWEIMSSAERKTAWPQVCTSCNLPIDWCTTCSMPEVMMPSTLPKATTLVAHR